MKITVAAVIYSLFIITYSFAQTAKVTLDTTQMRLGEQAHLNLSLTVPANSQYSFPAIPGDTIHKLEIIQRSKIDTVKSPDGKTETFHQSLTVTGFDSGYYVIEPLTFYFNARGSINRDSVQSEALLFQIQSVSVDTTRAFKDIKPPVEVPFTFMEALPYILGGLAIIALIILLVRYLKNRKPKPKVVERKIPKRPAHEIALEELKKTEEQKLWQQGFYKQYQSAVADTVRQYIEHRFGIQALEMPSDETLNHFKGNIITPDALERLRHVFQIADMVKFAKAIPVGSENELAMAKAIEFVNLTKAVTKEDFNSTVAAPADNTASPQQMVMLAFLSSPLLDWDALKFANKDFFWLLILIPFIVLAYYWFLKKRQTEVAYSSFENFKGYRPTFRQRLKHLPFVLLVIAFAAAVVALARPQSSSGGQNVKTEGIDIVMALDLSGSMLAEDLEPNRIDAAKRVAEEFIDGRPNDRIGLVVFSGESFTQCPLTSDHSVLKNLFGGIQSGMLVDGTAIGEGLATAVNRIKDSKAKSKVIILLTDGVNNIGEISPQTAGEIAKTFNIRVYTIGIGTTAGFAPYPFKTPFGIQYQNVPVDLDEALLKQIAAETGGKYFRASSTNKLREIYSDIDKLEKTKIDITEFHHKSEEFYPFIILALLCLGVERISRYTFLKTLP